MNSLLLDETIHTDYGQLDIVWAEDGGFDGEDERFFSDQVNGLVGAGNPHGVYVNLARRSGGSKVRVVLLAQAPSEMDGSWEDVVEVSVVIPDGAEVGWESWAGETSGGLQIPSGSYRLRVSARGRDAGAEDEFADRVVDCYLLELWTATPAPDAILSVRSKNAQYWHSAWGGRR